MKQLKSRSAARRLSAAAKLGTEGEDHLVPALIDLLGDPDAKVRAAAAEALGRIKAAAAVPPLSSKLAREPEPETRRVIIRALQEVNSPEAYPALAAALCDPVGEVGWQAAKALQLMRWEPANDSERAAWHLAVSQYDEAVAFGAAAIEPLTKLTHGLEFHRCIRVVEALSRVGGAQSVRPLLDSLFSRDFTVRAAAAMALGEVGDARAIDPLIHALKDANHQVCLAACISLGKMGDQRAVEPLIRIVRHAAPDVRTASVAALGKLRDQRAVSTLIEQLRDSDLEVREAAATALGSIGDETAIEHLVIALTDPHSSVRQAAANALRRIEPYWERSESAFRAIPSLQAVLKSKEYWVRHTAADVLKKLGVSEERQANVPLDSDGATRKRQAAQSVLKQMLGDGDREFRQAAAEALGRTGLSDSISSVVERLSDTDAGVRIAAARALESLRWQPDKPADKARQLVALARWQEAAAIGSDAVEALAEIVGRRDGEARQRAIEALVRIGGPKTIAALRAFTSAPTAAVREEALAAIAALESTRATISRRDAWSEVAAVPS